jgi:predicted nucleic acid-binding Zn ribbon protein
VKDLSGQEPVPPAEFFCDRCGTALRKLHEMLDGICEPCAKVRQTGDDTQPPRVQNHFCELGKFEPTAARRLSRLLRRAGIAFQTTAVYMRVPRKGGPVIETLASILVRFEDKTRAKALVYPDLMPAKAIRNCTVKLKYVCPLDWDQLEPTDETENPFLSGVRKGGFSVLLGQDDV